MSKYVKNLMTQEFATKLAGVSSALLVNVIGLNANSTMELRRNLRRKNIQLMVIKKSLARRATEGTPLASALHDLEGSLAFVWGAEDIVSLSKEIIALHDDTKVFAKFEARGGAMDGEHLSSDRVKDISKWPTREEQLSLLVGQILGPGSALAAALLGPGATLASQIKQKGDEDEASDAEGDAAAAEAGAEATA